MEIAHIHTHTHITYIPRRITKKIYTLKNTIDKSRMVKFNL